METSSKLTKNSTKSFASETSIIPATINSSEPMNSDDSPHSLDRAASITNTSPTPKMAQRKVVENKSIDSGPLERARFKGRLARTSALPCWNRATPLNKTEAAASQLQPARDGRNAPPK